MYEAVFKPTEPTSIDTHVWTVGDDSWQLADVMSSGTRSVVTRWRKPIQSVVVKLSTSHWRIVAWRWRRSTFVALVSWPASC
jgi:hypothetical protein